MASIVTGFGVLQSDGVNVMLTGFPPPALFASVSASGSTVTTTLWVG